MKINRDNFNGYLGEGIHTAFRKVGDSDESQTAWEAIVNMDGREWSSIVSFVGDAMIDALEDGAFQDD